jgi:hypothetical protein
MVHLLLVLRRVEMLLERADRAKGLMADVALPVVAVPGSLGGGVGHVAVAVGDLLVGDEAGRVALADDAVDGVAVEVRSVWAGASFEVVG